MASSAVKTTKMTVPLLDLKAQYATIREEVRRAVDAVLESQYFILGPTVTECEELLAPYCGCAHAVGVSSGSDALLAALMAEGIGPGDEVITTPYTFFATVGAIARLCATPVFVDICPQTYNLDPAQVEGRVTERTKAILPVHLYGQCAEMDPILEVAARQKLVVIEDAAQAIGAEYKGRRAGSMGEYGCFSFFPSKNLGAAGDGGLVTTRDAGRAETLRVLRMHGSKPKYYHSLIGGNFRLDALQAAIISVKFRHLEQWTAGRQANAARYRRLFAAAGLADGAVGLPAEVSHCRHIYNQFVIRVPRRDQLQAYLKEQGVTTEIYYPVPLHLQKCFAYVGNRAGDFPHSEAAAEQTLALPIYPELSDEQAQYVVATIARFLAVTA
ncbi:MAG: DegT/DnrJ/EryC1/StrS family aminotransferase [Thermoguttaceae bacterium]